MRFLIPLFFLYFCSMHLSVAGMELLGTLVFLSGLGMAIWKKSFLWPSKLILISFTGLFCSAILSFFINKLPMKDLMDSLGEFRWMLAYFGILQFFQFQFKNINFQKLLLSAQIVLIIAGFYSIYQFFTAHDFFRKNVVFHYIYLGSPYWRPNSFFGLPTTYAYASAMFFCVSLAFWMREKRPKGWQKSVSQSYFLMSAFNIFLTFTRAAWIAFVASTLGTLRLTNKQMFYRVTLVFVIFVSAVYTSVPSFRNRLNSMYDPTYVANHNRIYLWQANWIIFKENPILGIGFDENRKQIDTYLDRLDKPEVMRNHPHNTYLNFLAGLGILGFGFFIMFVLVNLKHTWQGIKKSENHLYKTLYIGAFGLQCVLLIGGFTECTFEDIELTHQYILFTALVEYLRQQEFLV